LSIVVEGNQIYAHGDSVIPCAPPAFFSSEGGTFELTGQIAGDGTVQLNPPASFRSGSEVTTISGSVPAAGATSWNGTYSVVNGSTSTNTCFSGTGSFSATPLPSIAATYAGSMSSNTNSFGVTMKLSQGTATEVTEPNGTVYAYLPLTGTLLVSGSPCFTTGSSAAGSSLAAIQSSIAGDFLNVNFDMDDGSRIVFSAFMTSDETTLQQASFGVIGGQCNQSGYIGTLTRQ